jgi:phage shock protein A
MSQLSKEELEKQCKGLRRMINRLSNHAKKMESRAAKAENRLKEIENATRR